MKLPEIEYGPVQTSSGAFERLDAAQRRAAGVIADGLTRLGMELVKTETQEAAAKLTAGLADIESDINARRYISTKELRDALGGNLDALRPELRERLTHKGLDINTGETVDVDRDDIPVWEVAGALFERRAKVLLDEASQRIGARGWRSEFQAQAQGDILSRKMRLAQAQAQAAFADLKARQENTAADFTRGGRFDDALAVVANSDAFTPAEKEDLEAKVEFARQVQPLEDRLLLGIQTTEDVLEVGKLIARLESGEGFDRLQDKQRIEWKRTLEASVRHFESLSKAAAAAQEEAQDELARNAVLDAYMTRQGRPLPMSIVPPPGNASSRVREWAMRLVESTAPGKKEQDFDPRAYAAVNALARDAAAFKAADLLDVPAFLLLQPTDQRHFLDLQRTLREQGPDGAKYTSFVGPQEETNLRLIGHGFHVSGKDAEDDALPVGYVQREVNRALWHATQAKARAGQGAELNPDERTAIIVPLVDKLVAGKAWNAAKAGGAGGGGAAVEPAFAAAVRDSAVRRGKGVSAEAQRRTFTEYRAWEGDITTSWKANAGGRTLTPQEALQVFDLIQTQGPEIKATLEASGKASNSAAIAAMAVRGYLRGIR